MAALTRLFPRFHPSLSEDKQHPMISSLFNSCITLDGSHERERNKLHKFKRRKRKRPLFNTSLRRLIDRKNRSASICYPSPLRSGEEHTCARCPSIRNRLLKLPPSFSRKLSSSCVAIIHTRARAQRDCREYRRIEILCGTHGVS